MRGCLRKFERCEYAVSPPHPKFELRSNFDLSPQAGRGKKKPYALAMSGNTASILVFSVAALNGLTI
jgi:hypothetical protein